MSQSRLLAVVDISNSTVNPVAKFANLAVILDVVVPILLIGVGLVGLAMLAFGALTWITASGDPQKVEQARRTITFAIIGIIVAIMSFLFIRIILFVTGTGDNQFNPLQF